jgi:hypothetical protein
MTEQPRVLVPVAVLEGQSLPEPVVPVLRNLPVVLLGYHVLPEQTPTEQGHMEFEDLAEEKLDDVAGVFGEAAEELDTRLVFTHDLEQTLDRVAAETGATAYLIPNPTGPVERVLVPVHPEVDLSRLVAHVAALVAGTDVAVTVFRALEDADAAEPLVSEALDALVEAGVPAERLQRAVRETETPVRTTATVAAEHDLVVMGERAPSLRTLVFGEDPEVVAELSVGPVVVVRRVEEVAAEAAEAAAEAAAAEAADEAAAEPADEADAETANDAADDEGAAPE